MPGYNPLVAPIGYGPNGGSQPAAGRGAVFSAGSVHLTLIGVVLVATLGLVLLRRAGFRFSVTVGGGAA